MASTSAQAMCCLCHKLAVIPQITSCQHIYCKACMRDHQHSAAFEGEPAALCSQCGARFEKVRDAHLGINPHEGGKTDAARLPERVRHANKNEQADQDDKYKREVIRKIKFMTDRLGPQQAPDGRTVDQIIREQKIVLDEVDALDEEIESFEAIQNIMSGGKQTISSVNGTKHVQFEKASNPILACKARYEIVDDINRAKFRACGPATHGGYSKEQFIKLAGPEWDARERDQKLMYYRVMAPLYAQAEMAYEAIIKNGKREAFAKFEEENPGELGLCFIKKEVLDDETHEQSRDSDVVSRGRVDGNDVSMRDSDDVRVESDTKAGADEDEREYSPITDDEMDVDTRG